MITIPAFIGGIYLLTPLVGTGWALGILGVVAIGLQVSGLVGLRKKVAPSLVETEELDPETIAELQRAYRFTKPSQVRRWLTLLPAVALPMSLLMAWLTTGFLQQIVGSLLFPLMITLAFAGLAEDKNDREFMKKEPDLHKQYSLWRSKGVISSDTRVYRQALTRYWLTGKDPDWIAVGSSDH